MYKTWYVRIIEQKGISKRFLDYFHNLDSTVGAKALGPDQTVSAKVHTTFTSAADRARTVDEQKGYSKTAHEVRITQLYHLSFPAT